MSHTINYIFGVLSSVTKVNLEFFIYAHFNTLEEAVNNPKMLHELRRFIMTVCQKMTNYTVNDFLCDDRLDYFSLKCN